jgi:hypothetical protein
MTTEGATVGMAEVMMVVALTGMGSWVERTGTSALDMTPTADETDAMALDTTAEEADATTLDAAADEAVTAGAVSVAGGA